MVMKDDQNRSRDERERKRNVNNKNITNIKFRIYFHSAGEERETRERLFIFPRPKRRESLLRNWEINHS